MTQLLIDTNVFLRFLLADNQQQYKQAENIFRKAKEKKVELIIPQIIIFEISFALEKYYKFTKEQVIEKLKGIISAEYFEIEDGEVFGRALSLYQGNNVSLVDCFLVCFAQNKDTMLFTFDKNLQNLDK